MTEEQRSDTPISDALAVSQDGMADALLAADGTPESRLRILTAWREHNAALSNAQTASLNSLMTFLENLLADVDARNADRFTALAVERRRDMDKLATQLDENHGLLIDRIHGINNHMQVFVDTQHEQAMFASQLEERIDGHDERLDRTEDRLAIVMTRLNQISRELQALRLFVGMPEPAELDVLLMTPNKA